MSQESRAVNADEYLVVARRYRPQRFADLVGQEHIAQALSSAILSHRVGHAYLFTGARGVGKTSSARILAKSLNCEKGPTDEPCNSCDICISVSNGDDVDVLEIDGASNRRIDEMRELRQSVGVRPSRARFKIYIIDEVHMLTKEAFNALLKTLEEPPEHVKFIFCTTEPEKIPDTILSRCQRFDFAGIRSSSIATRLAQIVQAESAQVDADALEFIARRGAGSMRDAQSLLEQLLSLSGPRITLPDVHRLLGTAGGKRLQQLLQCVCNEDAAAALMNLDEAIQEGVEVGHLLEQFLAALRDLMAMGVGASSELLLATNVEDLPFLQQTSRVLSLETILAMMQIVDQALSRLRYSSHGRVIVEMALVRLCKWRDLESVANLLQELRGQAAAPQIASSAKGMQSPARISDHGGATLSKGLPNSQISRGATSAGEGEVQKVDSGPESGSYPATSNAERKTSPQNYGKQRPDSEPGPTAQMVPSGEEHPSATALMGDESAGPGHLKLIDENLQEIWRQVQARIPVILSDMAAMATTVAISAPNRLAVTFDEKYTSCKKYCETPQSMSRLELALREITGQTVRFDMAVQSKSSDSETETVNKKGVASQRERLMEKSRHPLVRQAIELFNARPLKIE